MLGLGIALIFLAALWATLLAIFRVAEEGGGLTLWSTLTKSQAELDQEQRRIHERNRVRRELAWRMWPLALVALTLGLVLVVVGW
jgi:hypothetical protein